MTYDSGEVGTIFYIILEGSVSIKIPTVLEAEMTPLELFLFMLEHLHDVRWDELPNS